MIDSHRLADFVESASCTLHDKARLHSVSGAHASDWLRVIPRGEFKLSNLQMTVSLKWFLGLPLCSVGLLCRSCQKPFDPCGAHAVTCNSDSGIISRHNALRDVVWKFAQKSGLTAIREKAGILGDAPGDKRRPADVLLRNFSLAKDYCLDLAVTSPYQQKFINQAATSPGHAAREYFKLKEANYKQKVSDAGLVYVPMVVESFGRWHTDSFFVLEKIADMRSKHDPFINSVSESRKLLFQSLSVALIRKQSNMILDRMPRLLI
jgi:hypothetical protein